MHKCRMQEKRKEWAVKGHGEFREVDERDFFKARAPRWLLHWWQGAGVVFVELTRSR